MPVVDGFWLFLSASFLLWITPGPDTLYILARTLSQGRLAGVLSVLGISTGILAHTLFAAIGLSAILMTSALAFTAIKLAGAAYLIYLGVQALRSRPTSSSPTRIAAQSRSKIFWQGFVTNLLNPKIALFFLAFLPQFVDPNSASHPAGLFLYLGGMFVVGGSLWCLLLVAVAQRVRTTIKPSAIITNITGLVYIGLGLNLLRAKL